MKSFALLVSILTSMASFALENVNCYSDKTFQRESKPLKTNAEIHFTLIRNGQNSEINNLTGHVFVSYESEVILGIENAYMGFFKIDSLAANPKYRPTKYKNYIQFKGVDAAHTAGLESGMWGYLILDINTPNKVGAKYIFQAGDHMGGTTHFTCRISAN